jgi:hypothetical protein
LTAADLESEGTIYQVGVPPNRVDLITTVDGVEFTAVWRDRAEIHVDNQMRGTRAAARRCRAGDTHRFPGHLHGWSTSAGRGIGLGQAPTNDFGCGSGTTRANGFPRFTTRTVFTRVQPLGDPPALVAQVATTAVFMVMREYSARE